MGYSLCAACLANLNNPNHGLRWQHDGDVGLMRYVSDLFRPVGLRGVLLDMEGVTWTDATGNLVGLHAVAYAGGAGWCEYHATVPAEAATRAAYHPLNVARSGWR